MPFAELVSGLNRGWTLIEKLGEGDAGEVYRVEALMDRRSAILKRPRRTAFPSDVIRQATQIEREGRVLRALARLNLKSVSLRTPTLLDSSKAGTEFSERYFIVMTPAPGLSLAQLARLVRFANPDDYAAECIDAHTSADGLELPAGCSPAERAFVRRLAALGRLPDLLLLRALHAVIETLETIHVFPVESASGKAEGVLWNDIKPDHIFWDPVEAGFTLIDWGNAQYLEADGVTRDRQASRLNDYAQLIEGLGSFIATEAPELHAALEWPVQVSPATLFTRGVQPLKERLAERLQAELNSLRQVRQTESDLVGAATIDLPGLHALGELHRRLIALGESPDQIGAEMFFRRLAHSLVLAGEFEPFAELCQAEAHTANLTPEHCRLMTRLAEAVQRGDLPTAALLAALDGDWPQVMWEVRLAALAWPEPEWWRELSAAIRAVDAGLADEPLRPLAGLNRLIHALQAAAQRAPDRAAVDSALIPLKDEVLPHWTQAEPDPPNSDLTYRELERPLEAARSLLPEAVISLEDALEAPRRAVAQLLSAWERKDFLEARRSLPHLLLSDPERRRLIHAERMIAAAPLWLAEVRQGLGGDESLQDLAARLELRGRELRGAVGPAPWLDSLLEAMRQIRRGADPTDVLVAHPQARDDLGWLLVLERQPLLASPDRVLRLGRMPLPPLSPPVLMGMKEAPLGKAGGLLLGDPLDTWTPEARGSSARLFNGQLPGNAGAPPAAMKLMRPDRADYALPLFREEARVLSLLRDVPGVMPMLEMGFIRLAAGELPPEDRTASAADLGGQVQRYGLDMLHTFLADLDKQVDGGWIPYLALQKMARADNLLLHVDTGHTGGRFMPILEGLIMAVQICDVLETAHTRNIIYRDHKILHYYWQAEYNNVMTIDWNVAKRFPEGLSNAEVQFDLVQLGARALHYIFTGRPAPGALPMGPNRPEEIEAAAQTYTPQWTYDDQRLPRDIKDILEAVLSGAYTSARSLRDALQVIYEKYADLVAKP